MKTLRGSFYGVTGAFVWLKNICILHAPIMVLSDRCQTHQSCTFLCALSNGVYCTTRSSGSLCLHVCPWWEYNISGWSASPLAEELAAWSKSKSETVPFTSQQQIGFECTSELARGPSARSNKHIQLQPWPPLGRLLDTKRAISGQSVARTVKSLIVTWTVCSNKRD